MSPQEINIATMGVIHLDGLIPVYPLKLLEHVFEAALRSWHGP